MPDRNFPPRQGRNFNKRSKSKRPLIALFGSSSARRGERVYDEAATMGSLLAAAGFDLMTGGNMGVMEAASRGAHEKGAHVVGVTLRRFTGQANPWLTREIETANFNARFRWLIGRADGYIALHGGMGTLAEVAFAWQELALGMLPARPLVLVGREWKSIFAIFRRTLRIKPAYYNAVTLVGTPRQACALLRMHFAARTAPERPE